MGLIIQHRALEAAAGLRQVMPTVRKRDRSLFDQIHRAMNSVVLNIAEADGNDPGTAKARFASACGESRRHRARRSLRDVLASLGPLAASAQAPSDRANLVELSVEASRGPRLDVPPVARDVERRPHFFGRPASRGEPSPRIPGVAPAPLRDVEHHTLRSPLQLICKRLVTLANRPQHRNELPHDIPRPLVHILLHPRLLELGSGRTG